MKRIIFTLTLVAIACLAANEVRAQEISIAADG